MAFPEVKAYLLEEGNPNNFSFSKKIHCKAFSFVKVCCKLHIISKYLILVLYFYFQNVYLPIECVIVNFGFMSVVFLLTWSTSKQDLQIDRCFSCAFLLRKVPQQQKQTNNNNTNQISYLFEIICWRSKDKWLTLSWLPPVQSWKSVNLSISGSVLQILNFAYMHVNMFPKITMQKPWTL